MTIEVRQSNASDTFAIDTLLRRSYPRLLEPYYSPSVLVTAIPLIARANLKLVTSGTYFVALDTQAENALIACGGWTAQSPFGELEPGCAHIRHFGTDFQSLRKGAGSTIIRRCVAEARQAGFARLSCLSTTMAVAFYKKAGFQVIDETEIALRPGIVLPCVAMECDL